MLDTSVHPFLTRFDVDDASFEQAARVLSLDTNTFFVPLDAHRALVAADYPHRPESVSAPRTWKRST